MKKDIRKKIGVVTCLFMLLMSVLVTSIIQYPVVATNYQHIEETEEVVVQIMDESNTKEIVMTLTKQKADELETAIEVLSNRLQNATSREEIITIYREALYLFQSFGFFSEREHRKILQLFETKGSMNLFHEMTQLASWEITWNVCCSIAGDTTNTHFAGIRSIALEKIATYLQQHRRGSLITSLIFLFLLLDSLKPYSFWHRIYLGRLHIPGGIIPAEGWIVTCGLTGMRKWNDSITGNIIKDPWYDSTGVIGFTGIKILHKSFTRFFYLGTALFVSLM
ncbi:MAG TPA: hypothetical protein VN365_01880 [Candidatus Thermoplasmatota archaeon]|nr:hypothetical protein [Candidatus Thermoplasmatota archaeon]